MHADQPAQPRAPKPRWPLSELDAFRFEELPSLIQKRRGKSPPGGKGGAGSVAAGGWIDKAELEKLMGWKLFRGVYRPTLPGLISSNAPSDVISTTVTAFAELDKLAADAASVKPEGSSYFLAPVLKTLCKLRGVGPATASLLAAVTQPELVPFFGDELYAWVADGEKGGNGRKHGLKYNEREYKELWEGVWSVRMRVNDAKDTKAGEKVAAVDVEKAAYVLRRRSASDKEDEEKLDNATIEKRKGRAAEAESKGAKKRRKV